MQTLLQYISTRCYVDTELREKINTSFERIELSKGTSLLKQDQVAKKIYFVEKGALHTYYYHDGKQITSWFYTEDHFVSSWYSFYSQKPAFEEIVSLEDCVLYSVSFDQYQKLIADFPSFGNFARLLAEESLAFIDYFSKAWSYLSAKEKYNLLLQYLPDIEQRVKLGHIASFLGISQETLSRIRGKK